MPRKTGYRQPVWPILVAVIGLLMAGLAFGARELEATPTPPCGTRCTPAPPPIGPPLPAAHTYTSSALGFSVEYTDSVVQNLGAPITDDHSLGWSVTLQNGDAILVKFQGEAAGGRSAQQVVTALQQSLIPGATLVFQIPDAELGYTEGYGAVYDITVSPQGGQQVDEHFVIEASVNNDVAVELIGSSAFTPDKNGHPSPAQLEPAVEQLSDIFGNTVIWKGQSPK